MSKFMNTVRTHPEIKTSLIEGAVVAGLALLIFFLPHLSNLL